MSGRRPTHGMSGTREYRTWVAMKQRCYNPKTESWQYYGGRGIRVCDEWLGVGGFERFFAYMGPKPTPEHSIDRIENAKGYEPGNVRWATTATQHENRSKPKTTRRTNKEVRNCRKHGARICLRRWGSIMGPEATDRLTRQIRDELEERFGPPRNDLNPAHFVVDESYWDQEYDAPNEHFRGLQVNGIDWVEFQEKIGGGNRNRITLGTSIAELNAEAA